MSLPTLEGSRAKVFRFSPYVRSHSGTAIPAGADKPAHLDLEADLPAGCVRGICWTLAIEAVMALGLFAVVLLSHTWR